LFQGSPHGEQPVSRDFRTDRIFICFELVFKHVKSQGWSYVMNGRDLAKVVTFYGKLIPTFSRIGYEARSLTWSGPSSFDFHGQRWLVTGGSEGIGRALAGAAAEAGAEVVVVARNNRRLEELQQELSKEAASRIFIRSQDLSLTSGVNALLKWLKEEGRSFDALMNNVGMLLHEHTLTPEGRETSFSINLLGHYQLTEGLFESKLLAGQAVVVNMSSGGLYNAPLSLSGLNVLDPEAYNGKLSYAYAKRAQVALADYWDERLRKTGGRCYIMHPGWVRTPGVKAALPIFWKLQNAILRTPRQGADTALWLAATRPDSAPETVWFDRAPRTAHTSDLTRKPQCTTRELIDYLDQQLNGQSEVRGER
jgi:dehydrogenase/reductase SDR family protein 12